MESGLHSQPPVGEIIIRALRHHPKRLAFTGSDGDASYAEVADRIARLVSLFGVLGLEKGDSVAQLARNGINQWCVVAACYIVGLRSVTLQAYEGSPEAQAYFLDKSDADLVVVDVEFADRIAPLAALVPGVRHWFCHQRDLAGAPDLRQALQELDPAPLVNRAGPEEIVRVGFTSGSTGPPKGVLLSSRALAACAVINTSQDPWPRQPRALLSESVAGGFGNFIVPTLMLGGTIILAQRAEADSVLALMARYRPNMLFALPMLFDAILDHPQAASVDWSSLELLIFSGASIAPDRVVQAHSLFGPVISQVYGQTDCPKGLAILTRDDHAHPERLGSVGTPFPTVELTIARPDGSRAATDEVGELWARGPIVMSGYAKMPELSAQKLADGWLHTGDLASVDCDGYITLYDRLEYALTDGELTLPARTVEDAICKAGIREAALVHHSAGITAFVSADAVVSAEEVRASAAAVGWYRIDSVRQVPNLPISVIGRVNKGLLRQWAETAEK